MSDKKIKAMIANTFLEVADALETGQYGKSGYRLRLRRQRTWPG